MTKQITIVTVTYNSAATLQHTIDSLKNQTFKDFEYIIVDGASIDGTIEVILRNSSIITKWISEPDKGIYDAINKGIAMSTGEYVGLLHADDMLAADDVLESVHRIISEQKPDALYGDLEYIAADESGRLIRRWKSCTFTPGLLRKGWMPPHPTLYIKRKWFNTLGTYDSTMRIAADYDFILRLFSQPAIATCYLPKCVVKMRIGGASNKSVGNIVKKMKEDYSAIRRNKTGGILTLINKNVSKITQFFVKK